MAKPRNAKFVITDFEARLCCSACGQIFRPEAGRDTWTRAEIYKRGLFWEIACAACLTINQLPAKLAAITGGPYA